MLIGSGIGRGSESQSHTHGMGAWHGERGREGDRDGLFRWTHNDSVASRRTRAAAAAAAEERAREREREREARWVRFCLDRDLKRTAGSFKFHRILQYALFSVQENDWPRSLRGLYLTSHRMLFINDSQFSVTQSPTSCARSRILRVSVEGLVAGLGIICVWLGSGFPT